MRRTLAKLNSKGNEVSRPERNSPRQEKWEVRLGSVVCRLPDAKNRTGTGPI